MDQIMFRSLGARGIIKKLVRDYARKHGLDISLDLKDLTIENSDEDGTSMDVQAHVDIGKGDLWTILVMLMKGD